MSDLLVTTVNNHGGKVTLRIPQDERGRSLVESLKRKVRREELQSIDIDEADDTTPQQSPAPVDRRRGAPIDHPPSDEPRPASDDLEALRAEYADVVGSPPDRRWKSERIRKELAAVADDGNEDDEDDEDD